MVDLALSDDAPEGSAASTSAAPQAEAVALMRRNYDEFLALCAQAEARLDAGEFDAAAAYVEAAATLARQRHCGFYRSDRLERVLLEISRRALGASAEPPRSPGRAISRVLHVATVTQSVGGLSRMMVRWMSADVDREHSAALIRQPGEAPPQLQAGVARSGGQIHYVSARMGGPVAWARELRRIAAGYDLVVLHVSNEEPVPVIAFADANGRPPIVFVNHSDHLFWLGLSICDLIVSSRASGERLVVERRMVEPRRHAILPIQIDLPQRRHSRTEARAKLGIDGDGPLIVSVARALKYRTMDGVSFADMHVQTLLEHPEAKLVVVGPGEPEDWREAISRTGGRIVGRPETSDPSLAFEAADIYVDSYPFVSITSMLEAGGFGTPCATLFPYPPEANIVSTDMPGLAPTIGFARSLDEYRAILSRWLEDAAQRQRLGEETAANVRAFHTTPSWREPLEAVYERVLEVGPVTPLLDRNEPAPEIFYAGYPDILINPIFGEYYSPNAILKRSLRLMPTGRRLAVWRELLKDGVFESPRDALRNLLPEWAPRVADQWRRSRRANA